MTSYLKLGNPLRAIGRFFAKRRLIYLGSATFRAEHVSLLLRTEWVENRQVHFFASESGRRKIKGARIDDIVNHDASQTGRIIASWYYDRTINPMTYLHFTNDQSPRRYH